jgi:glycosyltransferase involved in cell wall biosynthesis
MIQRSQDEIIEKWDSDIPAVSICCITYNHEHFIEDALDGFLMQKTNFPFEILIHDDASPDQTASIIKKYEERFPALIFSICQTENQKSKGVGRMNPTFNFNRARGKYIAMCEGDDYWIDPEKLQKQYDFLEKETDCSVCFTAAKFENENYPNKESVYRPGKADNLKKFNLEKAIIKAGEFMPTASIFFRTRYAEELPKWFFDAPVGDLPLSLFLGIKGKYGYINELTCVYRVNTLGSWSQQMSYEKRRKQVVKILKTYDDFNRYTDYKYNKLVQLEKARIHFNDKKSIVKRAIAKTPPGRKIKEWFDL